MNEVDYLTKIEDMKNNGIQKGVYVETEGSTLQDLERFQDFLYRNLRLKKLQPNVSNLKPTTSSALWNCKKHLKKKTLMKSMYHI